MIAENSNRYRAIKRTLFGDSSGKIKTFAIISTENPLGWKDSSDTELQQKFLKWTQDKSKYNKERIKELKSTELLHRIKENGDKVVRYGGFRYIPLKGYYQGLENSFLIINIPLVDAVSIAQGYGQESFFFGDVSKLSSLIYYYQTFDCCSSYRLLDKSNKVTYEDEAEDFFSKFGFKFRINMKIFGDDVPEVKDTEAFEESFNIDRPFISRAIQRKISYGGIRLNGRN